MAPHPAYTIAGCSAPSVRAATSLKGCPPAGRCLQCTSSDAPSAQNTPLFVLSIPQNTLLSTKPPRYALRFAKFSGVFEEDARFYGRIFHGFVHYHGESASFFLSRFPASPKCTKEIFNKVRNCMKTRNLAFKFFGPKC